MTSWENPTHLLDVVVVPNNSHVHSEKQKWYAMRESENQEREKRIREEKLKEKNDEINHIIDTHNQISGSTPWMPSYGEND